MKSLDAVIRGLEACKTLECKVCPYRTGKMVNEYGICLCEDEEREGDALYYLKEYRERQNDLEKEVAYWKKQSEILVDAVELLKKEK